MTFKDGGAFDFHTHFERIKERLQQAVEVAREGGLMSGDGVEAGSGRGGGALDGVNLDHVHLDDLPAYEGPPAAIPAVTPVSPLDRDSGLGMSPPRAEHSARTTPQTRQEPFSPPTEPPPGYEEVQSTSVAEELERRLRQASP